MEVLKEKTIGEVVARDFRTAAVFSRNKIDFCCGGHKTIREVCAVKNINQAELEAALDAVMRVQADSQIDFNAWPLDLLADYIVKTHHRYVVEKTSALLPYLSKLCKVHGERHPELFEINDLFNECAMALAQHMYKEEHILFPYISRMVEAGLKGESLQPSPFGTVNNPIRMMEHEHESEGRRLQQIAELTSGYTPPEDACGTYRVTYAMLQEFEQDLHKHIHLENNILFPKAAAMEAGFNNE